MHVNIVENIFGALKIVTVDPVPMKELAERGPFGEWRRAAFTEVSEDETDRLTCRIDRDLYLAAERLRLGWLRRALTGRVEGPTVVSARDLLSLYPAV